MHTRSTPAFIKAREERLARRIGITRQKRLTKHRAAQRLTTETDTILKAFLDAEHRQNVDDIELSIAIQRLFGTNDTVPLIIDMTNFDFS